MLPKIKRSNGITLKVIEADPAPVFESERPGGVIFLASKKDENGKSYIDIRYKSQMKKSSSSSESAIFRPTSGSDIDYNAELLNKNSEKKQFRRKSVNTVNTNDEIVQKQIIDNVKEQRQTVSVDTPVDEAMDQLVHQKAVPSSSMLEGSGDRDRQSIDLSQMADELDTIDKCFGNEIKKYKKVIKPKNGITTGKVKFSD